MDISSSEPTDLQWGNPGLPGTPREGPRRAATILIFSRTKINISNSIFWSKNTFSRSKIQISPPPLLKLWSEYIIFVNHNNPWDYRTLFECSKFSRKWFISNEKIDFLNQDFQFLVGNDWFFGSKNDPCLDNFDQNKNWKNFTQIFFLVIDRKINILNILIT